MMKKRRMACLFGVLGVVLLACPGCQMKKDVTYYGGEGEKKPKASGGEAEKKSEAGG